MLLKHLLKRYKKLQVLKKWENYWRKWEHENNETLYKWKYFALEYLQRNVQNEATKDIQEIFLDKIYSTLKKMKINRAPGDNVIVLDAIHMSGEVQMTKILKLLYQLNGNWVLILFTKIDLGKLDTIEPSKSFLQTV